MLSHFGAPEEGVVLPIPEGSACWSVREEDGQMCELSKPWRKI